MSTTQDKRAVEPPPSSALGRVPGSALWPVALLMVLAFGLRVGHTLDMSASPLFGEPHMDGLYHLDWARAVAAGEPFPTSLTDGDPAPFFRAPLYPWLLGLALRLFGENLLIPRLLQALLGALTTGLTWWVGRKAFSHRVGLLAAALAATHWVLIAFDGELLIPTLIVPLNLLAIGLTLNLSPRANGAAVPHGRALLAGLAWGLSAIARPNVLLFLPFLILWLAITRRRSALPACLALALGTLIPILPITAVNATRGDRVLISSQAGVNLWIGNHPESDGTTAWVPGTRGDWWGGYADAIHQAEEVEGRALRPSEVSRYYAARAWGAIRDDPARALSHMLWKVRLFWTDWEIGNNQELRFFVDRFTRVTRFLPLAFSILAPLGVLGLLLGARRGLFPLWGFIPVYCLSVVAFFVCSRFRVPVLPPLMIFAAHGLFTLADYVRNGTYVRLIPIMIFLVTGAIGVSRVPFDPASSKANGLWVLGIAEARAGNTQTAERLFAESIAAWPDAAPARRSHGITLLALGRDVEAESEFKACLRMDPTDTDALDALAGLCIKDGRWGQAEELARQSLLLRADLPRAHYHLGRCAIEAGRVAQALEEFHRVIAIDPEHFNATFALARVLTDSGSMEQTLEIWDRVLDLGWESAPGPLIREAAGEQMKGLLEVNRREEAGQLLLRLEPRFGETPEFIRWATILNP